MEFLFDVLISLKTQGQCCRNSHFFVKGGFSQNAMQNGCQVCFDDQLEG